MPSPLHEALLLLFRNRPALAPELLREALHFEPPPYSEARIDSADLTEIQPTEYRADLVVLLLRGVPVLGIVVEVQLARDDRKRFAWPVHVATLRARLECPVCLLVVTAAAQLASEALDEEQSALYFDLILSSLSEAARRALQAMKPANYEYQSDFARQYFSKGREEGIAQGRADIILQIGRAHV